VRAYRDGIFGSVFLQGTGNSAPETDDANALGTAATGNALSTATALTATAMATTATTACYCCYFYPIRKLFYEELDQIT